MLLLGAGTALLFGGCQPGPSILALDLRTDMAAGVEFDRVVVTLDDRRVERDVERGEPFAEGLRVAELDGLEPGTHRVDVALLRDGVEIASRPLVTEVAGIHAATVLITRDCRGVSCPAPGGDATAAACLGGGCVDETCSEQNPDACGEPECAADTDCTAGAGVCATSRCVAGICVYGDDGSCAASEFCVAERGCESIPTGTEAEFTVTAPTALFATPNTVRWAFTVGGSWRDLRAFRVETGADPTALDRVFDDVANPELAGDIWFRGGDTVHTTTFGHASGSTVYARIVGVDWFGRESASDVASVDTPTEAVDEIVIFADEATAGYSIPAGVTHSDDAPFGGTHAYAMTSVCDEGLASCYEISRRQDIAVDTSAIPPERFEAGYLELAVQADPGPASRWSAVRIAVGTSGDVARYNYESFTIAANGEYRVYQIPLPMLGVDGPLTHAELSRGIYEFGVGGTWAAGATVRWDEVRIRY